MAFVSGDSLLPGERDLDRKALLRLPVAERQSRLSDALGLFYLALAGEGETGYDWDDELDDDTDALLGPDPSHPLILESVVAAEMNVLLERWLGITVPIERLLLDGLSIDALAAALLEQLEDAHATSTLADLEGSAAAVLRDGTPPDDNGPLEPFALAEIQQAYWIGRDTVYQLGGVSAHLLIELPVRDLDAVRAESALQEIVDRHDMLRSVVLPGGTQRVLPDIPPVNVEVISNATAEMVDAGRRAMVSQPTAPELPGAFVATLFQLDEHRSVLMVCFDMVKLDAWSVQLLIAEWIYRYDHPGALLPQLTSSFRDHVLRTTVTAEVAGYERARRYWLDRISDLPPSPQLPLAGRLGGDGVPTFRSRTLRWPAERWSRFKAQASRYGVTPSILLCAGYAEVLAAWSTEPRFTLSIAGGRPAGQPQLTRVLGPFARPALLAVENEGATLLDRVRDLQRRFSQDMEHRAFGGLDVLRELGRSAGRTAATMPVIFTSVLPQGNEGGLPKPSWQDGDPYVVWGMPQLLLENQLTEIDGGLVITWVCAEAEFADGVVADMFAAYGRLLDQIVDDESVWSSPALRRPDTERPSVIDAPARDPRSSPRLLHGGFQAMVAAQPAAPAVIAGGRGITYAELDAAARRTAGALRARGVQPGDRVGVCREAGVGQIEAVLGVLRAGATYVPLDPALPDARLHHLLDACQISVVLASDRSARREWPDGLVTLTPQRVADSPADSPADTPADVDAGIEPKPSDLAYVIFTSGSTGVPKGVMIEHAAAMTTIADINHRFAVVPGDRVLAVSSLSFDLSVYDIFGILTAGGTVVVPDPGDGPEPAGWLDQLLQQHVTVWNSVPALMQILIDHLERTGAPPCESLRLVMLSGDWIPVTLPARVRRAFPAAEVISLGGATEASIWSIFHRVEPADAQAPSIPYGRPLTGQDVRVLDGRLEERPDLVTGDLFIAGAGLARGYWDDDTRTAAAFLTHPRSSERLYRTGDLGRYRRDGSIEFLGRHDSQVKVNGHRIELGEVEAALQTHPSVATAVAMASGPRDGARSLQAFVVLATGAIVTAEELRDHVSRQLPPYAVPARIRILESLPLTANGKVDRSALSAISAISPALAVVPEAAAPSTGRELEISVMLAEVLGVPQFGVDDNLFDFGGTSLDAVQLVGLARERGIELRVADVVLSPTARALAGIAAQVHSAGPGPC